MEAPDFVSIGPIYGLPQATVGNYSCGASWINANDLSRLLAWSKRSCVEETKRL